MPEIIITGNGGTPWPANSPYYDGSNGNMAENAFGDEFGSDNSRWSTQWAFYQTCITKITSRPMYYFLIADLLFNRTVEQARMVTVLTDEDKRRFRLALATTLLGDGYYGFDRGDILHGQLWWFDEYNIDLGNPRAGYEVPNSYRTNVYGNGTYSREFSNGSVVVNPTTNVVTVSFLDNRTDVSTGIVSKTFNLTANDGRIFLKR